MADLFNALRKFGRGNKCLRLNCQKSVLVKLFVFLVNIVGKRRNVEMPAHFLLVAKERNWLPSGLSDEEDWDSAKTHLELILQKTRKEGGFR